MTQHTVLCVALYLTEIRVVKEQRTETKAKTGEVMAVVFGATVTVGYILTS